MNNHTDWVQSLVERCRVLENHSSWSVRFGISNYPIRTWYLDGYTVEEAFNEISRNLENMRS